ncbi:MAG: hypothetical protein HY791_17270 [Deltaproteobacteria bacterium]|nr:hypothetical protein [Deltaproteobacteria bacterium]
MPRPRKNRIGEYAALLAEELAFQLAQHLRREIVQIEADHKKGLEALEGEVRSLGQVIRRTEQQRARRSRTRVGRWVPGGPGRPPKNAEERVQAYVERTSGARVEKKTSDQGPRVSTFEPKQTRSERKEGAAGRRQVPERAAPKTRRKRAAAKAEAKESKRSSRTVPTKVTATASKRLRGPPAKIKPSESRRSTRSRRRRAQTQRPTRRRLFVPRGTKKARQAKSRKRESD